jgi:hypothetical protein
VIVPPKCSIEPIPDLQFGIPGIQEVAVHEITVLITGEMRAAPTNDQYPNPASAIPIPTATLASKATVSMIATVI